MLALQHLGAARTGVYFSLAPFIGAATAIAMLGEPVTAQLVAASLLKGFGIWLHLAERHNPEHLHEAMLRETVHVHDKHTHKMGP